MTNETIARQFLARFFGVTEIDVAELTAMLDASAEDGADRAGWDPYEKTNPGVSAIMAARIAECGEGKAAR